MTTPNSGMTIERVGECDNCGRDTFSVGNHIVCGHQAAMMAANHIESNMNIEPNEGDALIAFEILTHALPDFFIRSFPLLIRKEVPIRLYSDIHSHKLHFGYPKDVERKEELCMTRENLKYRTFSDTRS